MLRLYFLALGSITSIANVIMIPPTNRRIILISSSVMYLLKNINASIAPIGSAIPDRNVLKIAFFFYFVA